MSKRNYELITDFLNASAIGKTARKNARKKQVGTRARLKNIYLLKIAIKYFKKDLDNLTVFDMEEFVKALNENKIKKLDNKKYSEQTKSNIKITLNLFLRYAIKDKIRFEELTSWIETSYKKKEIDSLSEEDIKKIVDKCVTIQQKAIISCLFDSGCRAEEFLNLRLGDVIEVKGDIPYYRFIVRSEFSKTNGRTISLFWKPTTEILKHYLETIESRSNQEVLFKTTYDGLRKLLYKLGIRALGKAINPHLLRHTSATYYAGQGHDYFQLCKRYGWAIGSNMPHLYIDRSGVKDTEMKEKFIGANVKDLNEKLDKSERGRVIEKEMYEKRLKDFESDLADMKTALKVLKVKN